MVTLKLRVDAYVLLQKAHRLSDEALTAVKSATRMPGGRWGISCSDDVAKELWNWFDGCEAASADSRWNAWKIGTCRCSKWEIEDALAERAQD